jgi:hypothetical protein
VILTNLSSGAVTIDLALPFALVIFTKFTFWAVLILDAFHAPIVLTVRAILRAIGIHRAFLALAVDAYEQGAVALLRLAVIAVSALREGWPTAGCNYCKRQCKHPNQTPTR